MAWAGTATVWALSGGIPKSFAIGRAGLLSESEKKSILFAQVSDSHIGSTRKRTPTSPRRSRDSR